MEAAQVDGANRFRVLVSAEMPYIANVLAVTSVLGLIWTANYFDGIYSGLSRTPSTTWSPSASPTPPSTWPWPSCS